MKKISNSAIAAIIVIAVLVLALCLWFAGFVGLLFGLLLIVAGVGLFLRKEDIFPTPDWGKTAMKVVLWISIAVVIVAGIDQQKKRYIERAKKPKLELGCAKNPDDTDDHEETEVGAESVVIRIKAGRGCPTLWVNRFVRKDGTASWDFKITRLGKKKPFWIRYQVDHRDGRGPVIGPWLLIHPNLLRSDGVWNVDRDGLPIAVQFRAETRDADYVLTAY